MEARIVPVYVLVLTLQQAGYVAVESYLTFGNFGPLIC